MSEIERNIQKRWLHSHEEDTPTTKVFRRADYPFPRSRGRIGFDIKADGSYLDLGIAPADGRAETEGRWRLDDDVLTLECDRYSGGSQKMRIVSCNSDRLVMAR